MSLYRRGEVWWYSFSWQGKRIQVSARTANAKLAAKIQATHLGNLAQGRVGIVEKPPAPTLAQFIKQRIEPWAEANFERQSPKTFKGWYTTNLRCICRCEALAKKPLDRIGPEDLAAFAAWRQSTSSKNGVVHLRPSSVNASLRVLRRVLRLAEEWEAIPKAPRVKLLRGEQKREHVVDPAEEAAYLAVAGEPLGSVALMLFDSGMRPEECFRLRWESVRWRHGRNGSFLVTHGKTAAARRLLPMTARVRAMLESRWQGAQRPNEGWVFPAPTRSGHVEVSSVRKLHNAALKTSGIRPFVLYSIRHTFLTRLGASGLDVWTLARIAGHSSILMSSRYVHPGEVAVLDAIERLGAGHGDQVENQLPATISATSERGAASANAPSA